MAFLQCLVNSVGSTPTLLANSFLLTPGEFIISIKTFISVGLQTLSATPTIPWVNSVLAITSSMSGVTIRTVYPANIKAMSRICKICAKCFPLLTKLVALGWGFFFAAILNLSFV
jgi:hypothetical protein